MLLLPQRFPARRANYTRKEGATEKIPLLSFVVLSFPSSAWECVPAKLCFASLTPFPIPDLICGIGFTKQSLA